MFIIRNFIFSCNEETSYEDIQIKGNSTLLQMDLFYTSGYCLYNFK